MTAGLGLRFDVSSQPLLVVIPAAPCCHPDRSGGICRSLTQPTSKRHRDPTSAELECRPPVPARALSWDVLPRKDPLRPG